ncbi:hypothetical protein [Fusobacterium varium]|uniref:Toxin-antitoxin system, antitoxin component, Xre family n=1 Tax=Fusobacterium varium ATCC 27725 TaxID=469618 RepID=A0ABM6U1I5_FUSVA|nr:hypothetical protein [Fusobacterium varium]AVQ30126.1 hypothetical protein C4N18_02360 [Fusobacterium varium ATCC 27725]EES64851.1 hypothetical protein FVAG_01534 [Fusobacterium varium ATCC 27725]VEH37955.1 Uncharacterised protein [Fusobacterium varium]
MSQYNNLPLKIVIDYYTDANLGGDIENFCKLIGMSKAVFKKRIAGQSCFKLNEMQKIKEILGFSGMTAQILFFNTAETPSLENLDEINFIKY